MRRPSTTVLLFAVLFAAMMGVGTTAQTLSQQVLQLLARNNTWTGLQTFDRSVGLKLDRASAPLASPTDKLENRGGNLYFGGALVTTSASSGTVTSVDMTVPSILSVSGNPITSSGTLAVSLATQGQNLVFAGPTSGTGTPTFRALVAADIPPISIVTGTVAVANGGTGLTSGTSGGVLAFTASGTIASSGALTANRLVLGGGAGAVPTVAASLGTTATVLHGNAAGAPTFGAVVLTTDVSGILPVANGGTALASGTSGGVLYYSGTGTLASSGALTASRIVLGGGAGASPTVLGSLGTTTTVLHGNAAGAPTFGAVDLVADVTGTLAVASGGTALASYTQGDVLYASGTTTLAVLAKNASATRYLANTGTSNNPAWAQVNLANGVTGTLPAANGGTSITGTPTNGQLLIGNGSGFTLAALTGTANQVTVTNGAGTITLSLPQSIATASTPQFARLGLGTGAGATAVITTAGQINTGIYVQSNCPTASTTDWNNGMVQQVTLTGAPCTFTFQNPISGALEYTLILIQDGSGNRTAAWPGTLKWQGGAAPTLTTTASKTDICFFKWDGTSYLGRCSLNY